MSIKGHPISTSQLGDSQALKKSVFSTGLINYVDKFQPNRLSYTEVPVLLKNGVLGTRNNGIRLVTNDSLLIGQGGFSDVYKGRLHHQDVAVKIIENTQNYHKLFNKVSSKNRTYKEILEIINGVNNEALSLG